MWYTVFPKIMNMSLTASIIICVVLLCRVLLKKAPKIFSYALWSVVLFRLLCPISISAPVSLLGLYNAPVVEEIKFGESDVVIGNSVAYIPYESLITDASENMIPAMDADKNGNEISSQEYGINKANSREMILVIVTSIWLIGAFGIFGAGAASFIRLRKSVVGAIEVEENIYVADHIKSPFVMGMIRPRIYLPFDLEEKEKNYIILHEKQHIKRGDPIVKLLAFLALGMHWFNPLVWLSFVLSTKDMEMSCDEVVIKKLGEDIKADYATSLLQFATGQKLVFGSPLAFGERETASRIKNLAHFNKPTIIVSVLLGVVCIVVIMLCALNPHTKSASIDEPILEVSESNEVGESVSLKEKDQDIISVNEASDSNEIKYETLFETMADLTHDGIEDKVSLELAYSTEDERINPKNTLKYSWAQVRVYSKGSDLIYDSYELSQVHAGNGTFYLTEVDGLAYLLVANCDSSQGMGYYRYVLFSLDEAGNEQVIKKKEDTCELYDIDADGNWREKDKSVADEFFNSFVTEVEPLISDEAILLISCDINEEEAFFSEGDMIYLAKDHFATKSYTAEY